MFFYSQMLRVHRQEKENDMKHCWPLNGMVPAVCSECGLMLPTPETGGGSFVNEDEACPAVKCVAEAIRQACGGGSFVFHLNPLIGSWQERLCGPVTRRFMAPVEPKTAIITDPLFVKIDNEGRITVWTSQNVNTTSIADDELITRPRNPASGAILIALSSPRKPTGH